MKKIFSLLTLLIMQAGMTQTLSENQKLQATCRIWGFLKYYHPEVASGKYNWDEKLFIIFPEAENAVTKEEFSALMLNWINGLGEVPECKKCSKQNPDSFEKNFNMDWMQDASVFTPELSARLKHIENNRLLGQKHYAGRSIDGNFIVRNEPEYKDLDLYPAYHYRLLGLFRYWNIVEYFSPYKYQADEKWNDVLVQMLPKFSGAKDAVQYHLAIEELVAKLDDGHAYISSRTLLKYHGFCWPSFRYKLIDNKAVITGFWNDSVAALDNLKIGDIITKVNGRPVMEVYNEQSPYISASNEPTRKRNSSPYIFNGITDKVTLTFEKNGQNTDREIRRFTRQYLHYPKVTGEPYKMLEGVIGYVNMELLKPAQMQDMFTKFGNCKAVIFDVRNYPGASNTICNLFFAYSKPYVKFIVPDMSYPGKFEWTSEMNTGPLKNSNYYKGRIYVLVNEETQSAAEFTAMSLQIGKNVKIVGSQTAGADGNVSRFDFVGGYPTLISGLGVFYPDGRETQRIGIVPDVEVVPTIKGIQEGRDEVLEKAMELANQ